MVSLECEALCCKSTRVSNLTMLSVKPHVHNVVKPHRVKPHVHNVLAQALYAALKVSSQPPPHNKLGLCPPILFTSHPIQCNTAGKNIKLSHVKLKMTVVQKSLITFQTKASAGKETHMPLDFDENQSIKQTLKGPVSV